MLRWGERESAMTTDGMITVTFFLVGGLFPREIKSRLPWWLYDYVIAMLAPTKAFAFERSDKTGTVFIDGEVLSVERLNELGKHEIVKQVIADGARSAVRLRDTRKWAPFYTVTDRVVMTSR